MKVLRNHSNKARWMAWSESLPQNRPLACILIGENGHKGILRFGNRIGKEYKCEKIEEQQKRLGYSWGAGRDGG